MPDDIQGEVVTPIVIEAPVVKTESAQPNAETQVDETDAATGEEGTPAEKTFTQAELNEIIEKKTAKLIRQRDQERQQRETLAQSLAQAKAPDEGKPNIANYTDAEAYANDVAEWKLQERDRVEQATKQQRSQDTFKDKANNLLSDLEDQPGFDMNHWNALPISTSMAEAIVDADSGMQVKLALHLAGNPEEAKRIAGLTPARQAAEIGKLETKLATAVKVSKAPDPINPIGNGKTVTAKNPANASTIEEYIAIRKKEGARWSR